jgi:hypothetical protein
MKKTHIIFLVVAIENMGLDPNPHSAESMHLNQYRIRIHNTGQRAYKQAYTDSITTGTNYKL